MNREESPPEGLEELPATIFDLVQPVGTVSIPTALDYAYDMIWRQLVKRERQPGERLQDTELAAQLGISRTPVRQALHRLAQEEVVRFDARRGFSVRVFTARDVEEIYDVRGALEVLALQLAAPRLSTPELEVHLRALYEARDALHGLEDRRAIILHLQADLKLHNLLIHASGNGRLVRMLGALRSQQTLFQYWDSSYPQRNESASYEHERILTALMAGDIVEASRAMAEHIANSRNRVLMDLFQAPAARTSIGESEPLSAGVPRSESETDWAVEQS